MELYCGLCDSNVLGSKAMIFNHLNELLEENPEWATQPHDEQRALRYWRRLVQQLKEHFSRDE